MVVDDRVVDRVFPVVHAAIAVGLVEQDGLEAGQPLRSGAGDQRAVKLPVLRFPRFEAARFLLGALVVQP